MELYQAEYTIVGRRFFAQEAAHAVSSLRVASALAASSLFLGQLLHHVAKMPLVFQMLSECG